MKESIHVSKVLLASTMMLLLFVAATFASTVVAQENEEIEGKVKQKHIRDGEQIRHIRNGIFVGGVGAAVETDDVEAYRSAFRLTISEASSDTATDVDYQVMKGGVMIKDEGSPVRYHAIPESWTV